MTTPQPDRAGATAKAHHLWRQFLAERRWRRRPALIGRTIKAVWQYLADRRRMRRAVLIGLAIYGIVFLCMFLTALHPQEIGGTGPKDAADATVLISTFILIYTFFIAVFGSLVPALVKGLVKGPDAKGRELTGGPQLIALVLIFIGIGVDLYRVLNNTDDLYSTTMRTLPPNKIYDATWEFGFYFSGNVVIIVYSLVVVFLIRLSADSPDK